MRLYLGEAGLWDNRKHETIRKINQSGLPLVLFGKSTVVNPSFLQELTVPTQFICDNDPKKWGTKLWGLDVIGPDRLQDLYTKYNVLILVPFEHQIVPQLQGLPVPPAEIFRLDLYFEERNSSAYFQSVHADLAEIYGLLADQESKDTYEAAVRYRINRDPALLPQIALPRNTQYFPPALGGQAIFGSNEIFVDAGAFVGDTVHAFHTAVQGRYRRIYAFEPDRKNYEDLLKTCSAIPNVTCRQVAVSDCSGKVHFASDDSSSKADCSADQVVSADTLDSMLENVPVTYLKMDVEGMECAALRGAKKIIQTYRPKLAICIYHSNRDMVEVPKLILELNPDYKLYIRHYSPALVETVCYAI